MGTRYNTRQECIPQYRIVSKTKGILPRKYAYTGRSEEHHASGTGVGKAKKRIYEQCGRTAQGRDFAILTV